MSSSNGKQIYTTGEVAEICKVSQQTVIRSFDAGKFPGGFRVPGSRFRRIPHDGLISFMKANDIPLDDIEPPDGPKRIVVLNFVKDPRLLELVLASAEQSQLSLRSVCNWFGACAEIQVFRPHQVLIAIEDRQHLGELLFLIPGIRAYAQVQDAWILVLIRGDEIKADDEEALRRAGANKVVHQPTIDPREAEIRELILKDPPAAA